MGDNDLDPGRAAFAAAWNCSASLDDAARALGLTTNQASQRASRLRVQGVGLKKFSVRSSRPESLSDQAARAARDEGITFGQAANRFGITRQAIQQAYLRLFPGERRLGGHIGDAAARAVAVEFSRAGLTDRVVAEEVGFSAGYVSAVRRRAGIRRDREKEAAFARAVEAIRAGARAIDAAIDHGVSYNPLCARCRELGVELRDEKARDGRTVRAADRVERTGITLTEAARAERCAASAVSAELRRRHASRNRP